ncbi:tachykinin-like peptides receptor 86C isoform X2 [Penaeus monodon]|uniref:tachykinin-like peptides receptor 86C isoform X2 n=1 Tax=Penaeus monodon TaxID=6687 RepID=UPI0018A770BB|nr:tachykinin-like peptides receptor 86C isoform X2 [Penaeus monodon]
MGVQNLSLEVLARSEAAMDAAEGVEGGNVTQSSADEGYDLGVVVALSFFLVVSMVLALGGNVMVILTIVRHRGMRTRTNLLLANLAVADILVAVLDMPIALITIIRGGWIFSHAFCLFNGFTVGLGLMLSVHTLMWISIHKYISITKPFSRSVTPRKIVLMIVVAWAWTIFFNLTPTPIIGLTETGFKAGASQCGPPPPKKGLQYVHAGLNTTINLVIPLVVMSFCYYKIFKEVKDHLSRMQEFTDVNVRNSLIQQKQITETLCIVLSVFVLFWLPYIGYSLSLVFLGQKAVPRILNPIAYLFGYMNSACNPIIYALRSPSFRRGFSEIICWKSRYIPVNARASRNAHSRQVEGMMVSFRRSLWNRERKSERNLARKGEQGFGRQTRSHHHSAKKVEVTVMPKPINEANPHALIDHKKQGEELGYENEVLNCDGSSLDVNKSEIEETNSCTIVKGEGNYDEISLFNTEGKRIDGNIHKVSSLKEMTHESGLERESQNLDFEMIDKENAVTDIPKGISEVSKSCEGIDSHDVQSAVVNERKRHESTSLADSNIERRKIMTSSQDNVTFLLRNNLDTHIDGRRISNSHREIIVTTDSTMTNQVRSISAGDVRLPCSSTGLKRENIPPPLKLPGDKVKRTLMWQASVDDLCGSPLLSRRRIFHIRRAMDAPVPSCHADRARTSSETRSKKWSVSSLGSNRLGVAAFISNVKKSLTDLFNIDGETEDSFEGSIERGDEKGNKEETVDDNCCEED